MPERLETTALWDSDKFLDFSAPVFPLWMGVNYGAE